MLLSILLLLFLLHVSVKAEPVESLPDHPLPLLNPPGAGYRTPLAGEGFRTRVFGREVTVVPRDRRSTSAWVLIAALYEPDPEGTEFIPIGALSFWRHPDDDRLFQAEVAVLYNDIFWSKKFSNSSFEWVLTWRNYTVPFAQAELVDGRTLDSQELIWGYLRPGIGIGYRIQTAPGLQDNMTAVDLLLEPGYLYFNKGSDTSPAFVVPRDTYTLQAHVMLRVDRLERNLLELPHKGVVAGADIIAGYRRNWQGWGLDAREPAGDGRSYQSYTGYFLSAGNVPTVDSDRHRLIGVVHAGTGHNLDRFSAQRVGGGVNPIGEKYGSAIDPVFPGSFIQEFYPHHYLLLLAGYRFEPAFFAYLDFYASYGWLDRLRRTETGGLLDKTDPFKALGTRLTTGFPFQSRFQLAYNYNFSVIREDRYGGHEFVVNISKLF